MRQEWRAFQYTPAFAFTGPGLESPYLAGAGIIIFQKLFDIKLSKTEVLELENIKKIIYFS